MITPAVWAGPDRCAPEEPEQVRNDYAARRTYAYGVGEALALQRTISADAYLFLYKELVRLCKDRTYCWAGVAWLAQRLQTSPGTVKRWLTQLVNAGLIQRTPRPGGDTALTSIPALQAYAEQIRTEQPPAQPRRSMPNEALTEWHVPSPPAIQPTEASFFAPAERIKAESRAGSTSSRHTLKKPDPNPGPVGFGSSRSEHVPAASLPRPVADAPGVRRLVEAGVADPGVLQDLAAMPLAEIDAICRYVAQQPHSYNPPGLIVTLARTGLGPALLRRRERSTKRRSAAGAVSAPRASGNPPCQATVAPGTAVQETTEPSEWSTLWSTSKQLLAERIAAAEFTAWLDATQLIAWDGGRAVIGVPNVFARDALMSTYQSSIAEVLHTLTDTAVTVEVVIG